jgi:hypothetical protein
MHTRHFPRPLLGYVVLGHFAVTLLHGVAHAKAAVPVPLSAAVFILLVIEAGPFAGLALSRWRPAAGAWLVAATMAGALVFGIVNHFLIVSPDHVSHVSGQWQGLFRTTAVLLVLSEAAGIGAGISSAMRDRFATRRIERTS